MNKINTKPEFICACVFFMMAELLILLGIIGHQIELFILAGIYAFPLWICYISANQKIKHGHT
jgi:hypothetical protein